eukprot:TRINITY_DN29922_c0_g1_i1.p1 TRINITY_DN29922_c0_g1~~TRINITY_DN29922_c0_g1_i1.p1  ORF type:complete len:294 (+),score=125.74 TRINITY_DN29922_c0_g1_i1:90-971(+)
MKVISAVLLCVFLVSVNGWGEEGHKIVAEIAAEFLSSNSNTLVSDFCGSYTLPDIAPLPDDFDHTSQGRWSAPCHYCNLPDDATSFNIGYCDGQCCVVTAIVNYTSILQSEVSSPFQCNFDQSAGVEPCALTFLVHFVGDVHQPLHVGYGSDEGGNAVKVYYQGSETNLHAVWDTKMIDQWNSDYSSAAQELITYINNNPAVVKQYIADMSPSDWANESFQYVRTVCYNYNPSEKVRSIPDLGDAYYNANIPIVKQRLVAAGVRLANLLNNIFGSGKYSNQKIASMLRSMKFN